MFVGHSVDTCLMRYVTQDFFVQGRGGVGAKGIAMLPLYACASLRLGAPSPPFFLLLCSACACVRVLCLGCNAVSRADPGGEAAL